MSSVAIWTPESRGGIQTYSRELFGNLEKAGFVVSLIEDQSPWSELGRLQKIGKSPSLLHIQHEFGLFGSKIPPFYRFPRLVRELRRRFPEMQLVATAHTVLGPESEIVWRGRGWQTPFRWALNVCFGRFLRRAWLQKTWGVLDGVVVHSALQERVVQEAGCPRVRVIPHFVPKVSPMVERPAAPPQVVVFGYFTPEKGQDIVIRAWTQLRSTEGRCARLLLAGGVRRPADAAYLAKCKSLVQELGIADRVEFTGFVPESEVSALYSRATLVVAPFRETSGSGSLAQGLARGAAILASDHPINRELIEREAGCLAFFRNEDTGDCAYQMDALLEASATREALSAAARRYADRFAPEKMAKEHIEFYRTCQT